MSTVYSGSNLEVIATCSTGTESAPATSANVGVDLTDANSIGIGGIIVSVTAHDGTTALAAGKTADCYWQHPISGVQYRMCSLDLTIPATGNVAKHCSGFIEVLVRRGYLTWVPNALGVAVDVKITSARRS